MAFELPIPPGGLFPTSHSPAEATSLEGLMWNKGNHPSFKTPDDSDGKPPGLALLNGYHEKGYVKRYSRRQDAETVHGELILAPLGTLTKTKADGKKKHRVLQDLRGR